MVKDHFKRYACQLIRSNNELSCKFGQYAIKFSLLKSRIGDCLDRSDKELTKLKSAFAAEVAADPLSYPMSAANQELEKHLKHQMGYVSTFRIYFMLCGVKRQSKVVFFN